MVCGPTNFPLGGVIPGGREGGEGGSVFSGGVAKVLFRMEKGSEESLIFKMLPHDYGRDSPALGDL